MFRRVTVRGEADMREGLLALQRRHGKHVAGITPWLVKSAGCERDGVGLVVDIVTSFLYYHNARKLVIQDDQREIVICQVRAMSDLLALMTDDEVVLADARAFLDWLDQEPSGE